MRLPYRPDDLKGMQREIAAYRARKKGGAIALSLDHLEGLDVVALRGLITLLRGARASGTELTLCTENPQIRRVLAITALDRLFRVSRKEAAA